MSKIDFSSHLFPSELIIKVFSFLDYRSLISLKEVSHSWYRSVCVLEGTSHFIRQRYFIEFRELTQPGNVPWEKIFSKRRNFDQKKIHNVVAELGESKDLIIHPDEIFQTDFPTVMLNVLLWGGKYYFEVEVLEDPPDCVCQFGWASFKFAPMSAMGNGVGDCENSFAIDSNRQVIWHNKINRPAKIKYTKSDRVGLAIDLDGERIDFYCNGTLVTSYEKFYTAKKPFIPAITFNPGFSVKFHINSQDLRYIPPNCKPLNEESEYLPISMLVIAKSKFSEGYKITPNDPVKVTFPFIKCMIKETKELVRRLGPDSKEDRIAVARTAALLHNFILTPTWTESEIISNVNELLLENIRAIQSNVCLKYAQEILISPNDYHRGIVESQIHCTEAEFRFFNRLLILVIYHNLPPGNHPFKTYIQSLRLHPNVVIDELFQDLVEIMKKQNSHPNRGRTNLTKIRALLKLMENPSFDPSSLRGGQVLHQVIETLFATQHMRNPFEIFIDVNKLSSTLLNQLRQLESEVADLRHRRLSRFNLNDLKIDLSKLEDITLTQDQKEGIARKYKSTAVELYFSPSDQVISSIKQMLTDEITDEIPEKFSFTNVALFMFSAATTAWLIYKLYFYRK